MSWRKGRGSSPRKMFEYFFTMNLEKLDSHIIDWLDYRAVRHKKA